MTIGAVVTALLGSVLLATSASANVPTVVLTVATVADNDANTQAGAAVVTVPSDNKVDAADAVRFAISGIETGTAVTAVATNATIVTALHTDAAPVTSASGSSTWSVNTGTGSTAEFYVYTKTTAVGTVTINVKGNSFVYYVKGTAGPAYNLVVTTLDSVSTSSIVEAQVKVSDVFGNVPSATTPVVTAIGATAGTVSASDTATGVSKVNITYPATASRAALQFAITATDVVGLPAAVKTVTRFVDVADLATTNASLVAQLAAERTARAASDAKVLELTSALATEKAGRASDSATATTAATTAKASADLALATYKAKYNALAKKWNAKNPRAKVALLK